MGKVVERKKKKKGRPSLLDLQKRTLKEQQQQQQQQQQKLKRNISAPNSNPNHTTALTSLRRSTRRNPNNETQSLEDIPDDDAELSAGKRREKKFKLLLRLPSHRSSFDNSGSLNNSGSDSDSDGPEDNNTESNNKKRKINAIGEGSGPRDSEKGEKSVSGSNPTRTLQGTQLDLNPSTPLPDTKLLVFILDRLQKKDSYGVFSEPVDPEELPDYHEVIEHPMDFGTVRKKLAREAYSNLEQFEKDVFLICSNAMQYNAPDTIYFRQARSIQELAKKNFENLRQDSDDNEPETRLVRRGRPPTKNLKKPVSHPSLGHAGREFSPDATLATGEEKSSNYDQTKGPFILENSPFPDPSGRSHLSRNQNIYPNCSQEIKNGELTVLKGSAMKNGKKHFELDENRRNTYEQFHPSVGRRDPPVLTTFDREKKQLVPVGLHSEYGYARSLAQFASNLGPIAWKIASMKITRCLPPGVKFGPGWVGENDVIQHRPWLEVQPSLSPDLSSHVQQFSAQRSLSGTATGAIEVKTDKASSKANADKLSGRHGSSGSSHVDSHPNKPTSCFTPSSSAIVANIPPELQPGNVEKGEEGTYSRTDFNALNGTVAAVRSQPPFQSHPSLGHQHGMNGFDGGAHGFRPTAHMGKLIGVSQSAGLSSHSSSTVEAISRSKTNLIHPATANSSSLQDPKLSENPNSTSASGTAIANSGSGLLIAPISRLHPQSSWLPHEKPKPELLPQQKPESVPPDLNLRFQAPGSPSSGRFDSTPDLALQL